MPITCFHNQSFNHIFINLILDKMSNPKEIEWGATPTGALTKVKNPIFPQAIIQGTARLADGRDVTIMSKKDYDVYCYQFNELNSLE